MPHGCEPAMCEWPRKDEKKSAQTRTQIARGSAKKFFTPIGSRGLTRRGQNGKHDGTARIADCV